MAPRFERRGWGQTGASIATNALTQGRGLAQRGLLGANRTMWDRFREGAQRYGDTHNTPMGALAHRFGGGIGHAGELAGGTLARTLTGDNPMEAFARQGVNQGIRGGLDYIGNNTAIGRGIKSGWERFKSGASNLWSSIQDRFNGNAQKRQQYAQNHPEGLSGDAVGDAYTLYNRGGANQNTQIPEEQLNMMTPWQRSQFARNIDKHEQDLVSRQRQAHDAYTQPIVDTARNVGSTLMNGARAVGSGLAQAGAGTVNAIMAPGQAIRNAGSALSSLLPQIPQGQQVQFPGAVPLEMFNQQPQPQQLNPQIQNQPPVNMSNLGDGYDDIGFGGQTQAPPAPQTQQLVQQPPAQPQSTPIASVSNYGSFDPGPLDFGDIWGSSNTNINNQQSGNTGSGWFSGWW